MKFAPTITHHDYMAAALDAELRKYAEDVFETPLRAMITAEPAPDDDAHATDIVLWALLFGGLTFDGREFKGHLSARVSKALRSLGATRTVEGFEFKQMPMVLHQAVAIANQRARKLVDDIETFLGALLLLLGSAPTGIPASQILEDLLRDLDSQWGDGAAIFPEDRRREYREDLGKAAQKALREAAEHLQNNLPVSGAGGVHGVSELLSVHFEGLKRKLRGVAEFTTALAVAAYRELQAHAIGSPGYIWCTQCDHRVRADHQVLEGQFFPWDAPPITNRSTGARNHPGEDYNCRCAPRIVRVK